MKVTFIINATSFSKHKQKKLIKAAELSGQFSKITLCVSNFAKHSIDLAKEACADSNYIISVGGDGTLNEVINGVLQAKTENQNRELPIVGVISEGTANDFIKSLSFTGEIDDLLSLIKNQQHKKVDIGKLECVDEEGSTKIIRYFINIADIGFGANVVQKMNEKRSIFGSNFTYIQAILNTFLRYKPKTLSCQVDDDLVITGKTLAIAVANGKYFGSGLCIAPHALLSDGEFGVTHIGNVSMFDFLKHLNALKKGKKIKHAEAQYFKARHIEVTSEDKKSAVEADGEFIGYSPLKIDILPQQISFLFHQ